MNAEVKNIKVTIFGTQYSLKSDEEAKEITESAAFLDAMMQEIAQKHSISNVATIAILVALQVMHTQRKQALALSVAEQNSQSMIRHIDQTIKMALNNSI